MLLGLLFAAAAPLFGADLTGVLVYSSTTGGGLDGYPGGQQAWKSMGGHVTADLWICRDTPDGAFLNGPTDKQAGIAVPLADGKNVFYLFGSAPVSPYARYGTSLFIGGEQTRPRLTVHNATLSTVGADVPRYVVTPSGVQTLILSGDTFSTATGNDSFSDDGRVVTIGDFAWYAPGAFSRDRVGMYSTVSDGVQDFVGRLEIDVQVVPEPGAVTLMLLGSGMLAFGRRRGRVHNSGSGSRRRSPPARHTE